MEKTYTELHTHLLGMMRAEDLLLFAQKYTDYIYYPIEKNLDDVKRIIPIADIFNDQKALNQLRIKKGTQVPDTYCNDIYANRGILLDYLANILCQKGKHKTNVNYDYQFIKDNYPNINEKYASLIYEDYINLCLADLYNQGVNYVEISNSSLKKIKNFKIDPYLEDKIKCRFLLSTDRAKRIKSMKSSAKLLREALENGNAVGFDIMGLERPLTDIEKIYSKSEKSYSFKRKLEIIFEILLKYENTALRIHSGENQASMDNTLLTLRYIDEIANEMKLDYLPTEIRIGHGIHFNQSDEYLELLKNYNCIIEINASSNYALSNISDYSQIPYDYYLDNDIPVLLSTDGHGLYETTIPEEDKIASQNTTNNQYKRIIDTDNKILRKKLIKWCLTFYTWQTII